MIWNRSKPPWQKEPDDTTQCGGRQKILLSCSWTCRLLSTAKYDFPSSEAMEAEVRWLFVSRRVAEPCLGFVSIVYQDGQWRDSVLKGLLFLKNGLKN